jgi:ribonuclease HI
MKIILNTDGGARGNPGPSGIGVVLKDETGKLLKAQGEYIGIATNNEAEYKALILGLKLAQNLQALEILVRMDSELIVRQMQGVYKIKDEKLKKLAQEVFRLKSSFKNIVFVHVPREKNSEADALVNEAIDNANLA